MRVHRALFFATFVTTTFAGTLNAGYDPTAGLFTWVHGLAFSVPLLAILLAHEMGHYVLAQVHGVPATLPYFLPGLPFLIGTFGAFIKMSGMPRSRRALFDIGAAGPWAGILVAIPVTILGLSLSEVRPTHELDSHGWVFGEPLLFQAISALVFGRLGDETTVLLHPMALAGWFGMFVTFLNLLPVGQLDGGHVVYALFGRRHATIARLALLGILGLALLGWDGWFVWAAMLVFVLKVDHPDTRDSVTELDPVRRKLAWATIGLLICTFMPVPIDVGGGDGPDSTPPGHERPALTGAMQET